MSLFERSGTQERPVSENTGPCATQILERSAVEQAVDGGEYGPGSGRKTRPTMTGKKESQRSVRLAQAIAGVLVVCIIVGSMGLIFSRLQQSRHSGGGKTVTASHNQTPVTIVYTTMPYIIKMDARTGKTLWQTRRTGQVLHVENVLYTDGIVNKDGSFGNGLSAIDPANGKLRWTQALEDNITQLVAGDGRIYVAVTVETPDSQTTALPTDASIYVLDEKDGTIENRYTFPDSSFRVDGGRGARITEAIDREHNVLFVGLGRDLYGLDTKAAGKVIWHSKVDQGQVLRGMQIGNGGVYLSTVPMLPADAPKNATEGKNRYVYAFNATTGEQLWQSPGIVDGSGDQPTVVGQSVYYSADTTLYAFAARSGKILWRYEKDKESTFIASAMAGDGLVYISEIGLETGTRSFITALHTTDGSVVWQKALASDAVMLTELVNHTFYIIERPWQGHLLALDAATGKQLWQRDMEPMREAIMVS